MPPRAKKVAALDKANSHHNHSLGLAAPGRPIPKLKSSNPNLSANSPNANLYSFSPDSPQSPLDNASPACSASANGTAVEPADPAATEMYPMCRVRAVSGGSENDVESHTLQAYKNTNPLMIDVSAPRPTKYTRQQKSKLAMATTILTSCPLWDVIAILIVLLQLPPAIVAVVHLLFAMITFVPSSATTSLSNLPTIHEILVGSAGSPSIQTIIIVDVLMLLLFIPLWTPAQNVALDLAQAVIAISLGGAAASKGGTTNSVVCCIVIVALSQVMRWRTVRQLGVNLFWSGLIKYGLRAQGPPPQLSEFSDQLYTPHPWPRCLLGVHILAQGVLRIVRRYLLWRQAQADTTPLNKRVDSDLASHSPALGTPRSSSVSPVLNSEAVFNSSSDGRPPGPSPATGKDRSSGGKKKKKQSQQARMQQPFWAALASTKVTVSKEYEQSQASLDARIAGSVDVKSMGTTDFKSLQNRFWIKDIGATDISFGVCLPLHKEFGGMDEGEDSSKDTETPSWSIRINGASWMSIKRTFVEKVVDGEDEYETWDGHIYGLTPLASYNCEFIREGDHSVIYDTTLITQPAPSTETATLITPPTQTLQPSSPTTTLRNSILTADLESEKSKNNFKAARKQHKITLDRLQSQIDREKSKLSNTGGADDRQRQRVKQLDNSIQKARMDQEEAEHSILELGPIPQEDKASYEGAKKAAKERQRRLDIEKSNFAKIKKDADKKVASASNELQSILNKRSKMEGKRKDKAAQLVNVGKEKTQAAQAKSIRHQEKVNLETRRRQELQDFEAQVAEIDRQYQQEIKNHSAISQQTQQYEELYRRIQANHSTPGTPETHSILPATSAALMSSNLGSTSLPGSRPSSLHVSHSGFTPGFQFPVPIGSGMSLHGRKRSSSLETDLTYYNGLFAPTSMAPQGLASFSPTSSSALLANSTALAPPSHHGTTPFPNLFNYNGTQSVPAPVGAEKESRRKGSDGSHGSFKGGNGGSENGSPRFGKLSSTVNGVESSVNGVNHHHHHHHHHHHIGKLGMVSPPSSAIWDRKKD